MQVNAVGASFFRFHPGMNFGPDGTFLVCGFASKQQAGIRHYCVTLYLFFVVAVGIL